MALMGPQPLFFMILILLTISLDQLSEGATYADFVNRHIDYDNSKVPRDQNYCNIMMQRRGLTLPVCKPINTFIHAPAEQLIAVCRGEGKLVPIKPDSNLYDSNKSFDVTICKEGPDSRKGNCRYRGSVQNTKVRVGCVQMFPVHLETQRP